MNSEDLRKVIEDKLIAKGMDEDIALQIADEIIEYFVELEEADVEYREEYD